MSGEVVVGCIGEEKELIGDKEGLVAKWYIKTFRNESGDVS